MGTENTRLLLVAAAVALVMLIPVLGSRFGGPPTTVTNVVEGTEPVDVTGSQARQKRLAAASAVDGARVIGADAEPDNWLAHGRTYGEQRFSPLNKINADNVKDLGLAWTHRCPPPPLPSHPLAPVHRQRTTSPVGQTRRCLAS